MASILFLWRPFSGIDRVSEWSAMIPADIDDDEHDSSLYEMEEGGIFPCCLQFKIHSLISGTLDAS